MTKEEFRKLMERCGMPTKRKKPQHRESQIQCAAVHWFRLAHPTLLCFSVPNGGARDSREASYLKKEGVLSGVSDLIIVAKGAVLFVEMKTEAGHQQESQKEFQRIIEHLGHEYALCHSLKEFQLMVENWLKRIYKV